MLPRAQRLVREEDFHRVYRRGRFVNGAWMTLRICPGLPGAVRFGIVIPNAVLKRASARNRIRRQLRALIAARYSSFPPGFDWVLQVRATPPRTMAALREAFTDLQTRIF